MNNEAFYIGVGEQLKAAGLGDWFNTNVKAPLVNSYIDTNYSGLGRYDPASNGLKANYSNIWDVVRGNQPKPSAPKLDGFVQNASHWLGSTGLTKGVADFAGRGDDWAGKVISDRSHGMITLDGPNKFKTDLSKAPELIGSHIGSWIGKHPLGAALGAGGLALGAASLFGGGNSAPVQAGPERVAAPGAASPAPYAGRQGNLFTKYQE